MEVSPRIFLVKSGLLLKLEFWEQSSPLPHSHPHHNCSSRPQNFCLIDPITHSSGSGWSGLLGGRRSFGWSVGWLATNGAHLTQVSFNYC